MTNDSGSSNPWFSGKRKTGDELPVPERKPRTTENDMSSRFAGTRPTDGEGKTRWFGVRQSYTNLPAHKLINELQQGRYDPYSSIDGVRSRSLDHMVNPTTNIPLSIKKKTEEVPIYTPPMTGEIDTDWTTNYATPFIAPLTEQEQVNSEPSNSVPTDSGQTYSFVPQMNPMEFVEQFGGELPTETLEEMSFEDFSPIDENQNGNVYSFENSANNSATRLPAFKKPPRSLT